MGSGRARDDDVDTCDAESMCAEFPGGRTCRKICTFDSDGCPNDQMCWFFVSGVGLCMPTSWDGGRDSTRRLPL